MPLFVQNYATKILKKHNLRNGIQTDKNCLRFTHPVYDAGTEMTQGKGWQKRLWEIQCSLSLSSDSSSQLCLLFFASSRVYSFPFSSRLFFSSLTLLCFASFDRLWPPADFLGFSLAHAFASTLSRIHQRSHSCPLTHTSSHFAFARSYCPDELAGIRVQISTLIGRSPLSRDQSINDSIKHLALMRTTITMNTRQRKMMTTTRRTMMMNWWRRRQFQLGPGQKMTMMVIFWTAEYDPETVARLRK